MSAIVKSSPRASSAARVSAAPAEGGARLTGPERHVRAQRNLAHHLEQTGKHDLEDQEAAEAAPVAQRKVCGSADPLRRKQVAEEDGRRERLQTQQAAACRNEGRETFGRRAPVRDDVQRLLDAPEGRQRLAPGHARANGVRCVFLGHQQRTRRQQWPEHQAAQRAVVVADSMRASVS
jgi:hypothetical protein